MKQISSRAIFLKRLFGSGAYYVLAAQGLLNLTGLWATAKAVETPSSAADEAWMRAHLKDLPYRQDDPRWKDEVMWDRKRVIQAHSRLNHRSLKEAQSLLREFDDGNTIGNEGCLLTCLAMVLQILLPSQAEPWTPSELNRQAHQLNYYTPAGVSMAPLYADLVSELSLGAVQLGAKEEYLAGEPDWPAVYVNTSALVRAYRRLSLTQRRSIVVMLKTGTYDDTIASHYVLLRPDSRESPDFDDPEILDPAQPFKSSRPWRLSDSARRICADPEIRQAWQDHHISELQIGGVWIFTRYQGPISPIGPLLAAWAAELEQA